MTPSQERNVPATDLHVVMVDQQDPRLGRQVVHDPRSRAFPMAAPDTSTWRSKTIRMYDPTPNPNQTIGDCTGCDKAMEGNAAGNRVSGRVLTMADAEQVYSLATELDPWDGSWPPTDTGSSSLAAAKAAQRLKLGSAFRDVWIKRAHLAELLADDGDAVVQDMTP
jgi:hypothetical protein